MTLYHVTLGGQGLMLDLTRYVKGVQPPFADKAASGARGYDDLSFEQVWEQSDWSGGDALSQVVQWDPAWSLSGAEGRYRSASGLDGFTVPGSLRLGPDLVSTSPTANNGYTVLQPFNGKLYAGTSDGKTYQLTPPSTWALSRDHAKAGGMRAYAVYNGALFAGQGTDGIVDSFDGTTWTAARFTLASTTGVRAMAVRDATVPTLYCLGSKTAPSAAVIQRWNGSTLSAVLYTLQEPSGFAMVEWSGSLWIFGADTASRRGGVYTYDGSTYNRVLDIPDNYVCSAAVADDAVYCGMADGQIWRWDGSDFAVVGVDVGPSTDEIRGLALWRGGLWVSVRNGSELRLKRYDPRSLSGAEGAWSEPAGGTSVDGSANSVQGLAVLGGALYAAGQKTSSSAPVVVATAGVYPTAAKTLETALFSAELAADTKVFRSVTVQHAPLVSGQSVEVQYRLEDSGGWSSLGTSASVGATVATFTFSGGGGAGKLLALRLLLVATASATPVLYRVLTRYALQPAVKRRWEIEALYEGTAEMPLITLDQTAGAQTGQQIESAVWALKAAAGVSTFLDLDGASYSVWFLDHAVRVAERSQRRGSHYRGRLTLLEA